MSEEQAGELIVCGGGLAGLTAAVSALEQGASVTLIEKAPEFGGTTALSGGLVWTFKDFAHLRDTVPAGNPALQWLVYDNLADGRRWLAGRGATLGPEESLLGHGWGQIMDPPQAIALLGNRFACLGGRVTFETGLHSLIDVNGIVRGVRALRGDSLIELTGRAVILATGGFQGNPDLLARYVLTEPSNLVLRASPWSTGDGFIAAVGMGANASGGLGTFYGHALTSAPARYGPLEFRDVSQYYGQAAVALNLDGERFCDESDGVGEENLNQRLARQPHGRGFYVIDGRLLDSFPIEGYEIAISTIVDRARRANGVVVEAPTLEQLCVELARFGLAEGTVKRTLLDYNSAIESGRADELVPPRRRRRTSLSQPPFLAVGVQAAITFTMGGLDVDENCRVLWRCGSSSTLVGAPTTRAFVELGDGAITIGTSYRQAPIRGLYAAGCDVGNISHGSYVGGLAVALVTGRTAGLHATAFARAG